MRHRGVVVLVSYFLLQLMIYGERDVRCLTMMEIGVYYHVDYVGSPRDYKWINTIQLEKTVEQVCRSVVDASNGY